MCRFVLVLRCVLLFVEAGLLSPALSFAFVMAGLQPIPVLPLSW